MAAYAAGSSRIDLLAPEQQRRAGMQGGLGGAGPAYGALLPHNRPSAGSSSDAVILVSQNGSMFGVPAAHLTFDAARDGAAAAVVASGAGEQCQAPPEQHLGEGSGDDDKALALLPQPSPPAGGLGQDVATQCKPAELDVCSASHLGVYPVQQTGSSSLLVLPRGANGTAPVGVKAQQRGGFHSMRRSWLILLAGVGFGATASAGVLYIAMRKSKQAAGEAVTVVQQHATPRADGSATVTPDASAGGKGRRRRPGVSGRQGHQMSNRLKGLMHQAALDVPVHAPSPPEGGLHQKPQMDDTLPSSVAVATGLTDPNMRRREIKDGVILVGRMKVRCLLRRIMAREIRVGLEGHERCRLLRKTSAS